MLGQWVYVHPQLRSLVICPLSLCSYDTWATNEPLLVPLALFKLVEDDWKSQTHKSIDAMDSATMHVWIDTAQIHNTPRKYDCAPFFEYYAHVLKGTYYAQIVLA